MGYQMQPGDCFSSISKTFGFDGCQIVRKGR